jgi:hypothetical protein
VVLGLLQMGLSLHRAGLAAGVVVLIVVAAVVPAYAGGVEVDSVAAVAPVAE